MRKPKPRFKVGDIVGDLIIVEYLGFLLVQHIVKNKNEHKYKVKCLCGCEDIKTQHYLIRKDVHLKCVQCTNKLRNSRTRGQSLKREEIANSSVLQKLWPIPGS